MKIIDAKQVKELVSAKECVEVMKQALMDLEQGKCIMPARRIDVMPNTALLGYMPAYSEDYFGAKLLTAYGKNTGTQYPSHMGFEILFESEHCSPVGLVDAGAVTEVRTGAVSAAATDALARKDAHTLGIIGAGAQARSHTAAMVTIRDITAISVYDIRKEAAEKFAKEMSEKYGIPVTVADSVREAVKDKDIVCTVTPSKEAYLTLDMIAPGTHVNAVGTFSPTTREAASDLVAASKLYADQVSAMKSESGEYLIPLHEGLFTEDHIQGSIGQLLLGQIEGRTNDQEITLFDALGLAVEDLYCAKLAYLKA